MQSFDDFTSDARNFPHRVTGSYRLRRAGSPRQDGNFFRSTRAIRALLLVAVAAGALGCAGCAKKVVVPDLANQDLAQAEKALAAVGLKPGTIGGAPGAGAYVVSQSPAVGQQVAANSKVDLVVEMPVSVPTLTGSKITDAVSMLQGLGLRVGFVKKPEFTLETKVALQDPAPNSLVHRGALVTLTVSVPRDIEALLGSVAKEAAYQNLKPEYQNILKQFLGDPSISRSMDMPSTPNSPSTPTK
jgi:beta-lactam-binding protein with PASTA domain